MPPTRTETGTMPVAEPWQRPALTARGQAAAHLSRFQDQWNDLSDGDRQWFAEWLRDLFADAVCPELPPAPSR